MRGFTEARKVARPWKRCWKPARRREIPIVLSCVWTKSSRQLIAETRDPIRPKLEQPTRDDYESRRSRIANLLPGENLLPGWNLAIGSRQIAATLAVASVYPNFARASKKPERTRLPLRHDAVAP
jgi:hypothetical protein